MADINLKRFVDIDIVKHIASSSIGTRGTVILFTPEGTESTITTVTSYEEAEVAYPVATAPTTLAYLKVFFDNGGIACRVIEGVSYSTLTAAMVKALDDKYIVVACAVPSVNAVAGYTAIKNLATTLASDSTVYGINEKILLARTSASDSDSVKNFAVKYSTVLGAEMTMAAYLSQINVYGIDTVKDYSFTSEALTEENVNDTAYGTIITENMNVDVYLAGSVRNMGGNTKDGSDLTNSYVRIILHQTLTDRLLTLLTSKIKGVKGLNQIYAVMADELENYRRAGYLTTDEMWTDPDMTVTYNNQTYTVITKGTSLIAGYVIKVLPLASLTTTDKTERKTPPIYVIIADQYGIRKITINGEII